MERQALVAGAVALAHLGAAAALVASLGWLPTLQVLLFFWLGLGGGWFFVLPVVERLAGTRVAVVAAIATGLAFGFMAATHTLPSAPPLDEDTCHDQQGSHRC